MEITDLIKEIEVYNDGHQEFIKLEDVWSIALLGCMSNRDLILSICKDKDKLNELLDIDSVKHSDLLTEILIKNFSKIGIHITDKKDDNK